MIDYTIADRDDAAYAREMMDDAFGMTDAEYETANAPMTTEEYAAAMQEYQDYCASQEYMYLGNVGVFMDIRRKGDK